MEIEICINSDTKVSLFDNVEKTRRGGAARIELCSAMHLDGLTPSPEQTKVARTAFADVPGLMVMIRPRGGDFYFLDRDIEIMLRQIDSAAENGANGVVVGVLRKENCCIDKSALRRLAQAACDLGLSITFHRAFDATPNFLQALDDLMEVGVHRVLTSGVAWGENRGALNGISQVQQIAAHAATIEIIIGGGVSPANAKQIITSVARKDRKISLHAYSAVLSGEFISENAVRELVKAGSMNSLAE